MPAAPVKDASQPIVYVNGKRHELPQGKAETTLLQYLRGTSPFMAATPGVPRFWKCRDRLAYSCPYYRAAMSFFLLRLLAPVAGLGLTGTKLGCGEGGCGACTVMVSSWDQGKLLHRSINACLCPMYAVEGMHVVTVEGTPLPYLYYAHVCKS